MTKMSGLLAGFLTMQFGIAAALADETNAAADFGPCLACHSLDPNEKNLPGPNLADLKGRRLGGDQDFGYSPVFEQAFETGDVWTPELLDQFLADPEGMFPGMWMSYQGLEDAARRSALVDFILLNGLSATN
ncbi:MAG: hypothetical protein AAGA50_05570 [Pseudomonadota bacterium]